MAHERFRQTGEQSFFGRWVYDRIVPKDHFLMQLDGIIPWQRFAKKLVRYYQGKALYGPAPYNPVMILKMLLLSFLPVQHLRAPDRRPGQLQPGRQMLRWPRRR